MSSWCVVVEYMHVDSQQWVGRIEPTGQVKMEAFTFNATIILWSQCVWGETFPQMEDSWVYAEAGSALESQSIFGWSWTVFTEQWHSQSHILSSLFFCGIYSTRVFTKNANTLVLSLYSWSPVALKIRVSHCSEENQDAPCFSDFLYSTQETNAYLQQVEACPCFWFFSGSNTKSIHEVKMTMGLNKVQCCCRK